MDLLLGLSEVHMERGQPRKGGLKVDTYGFLHKGYVKKTVTAVAEGASPYALTANQSGQVFTNTGATASVQFNLPTLTASTDLGLEYTFVKLTDDNVVIDAAAGDTIADSAASGQVQNTTAAETYATITLISVSTSAWVIAPGAHGTWTTT